MRFILECHRDDDGRLGGELWWEGGAEPVGFSGNLELLRLIEDHGPAPGEADLARAVVPSDPAENDGIERARHDSAGKGGAR